MVICRAYLDDASSQPAGITCNGNCRMHSLVNQTHHKVEERKEDVQTPRQPHSAQVPWQQQRLRLRGAWELYWREPVPPLPQDLKPSQAQHPPCLQVDEVASAAHEPRSNCTVHIHAVVRQLLFKSYSVQLPTRCEYCHSSEPMNKTICDDDRMVMNSCRYGCCKPVRYLAG